MNDLPANDLIELRDFRLSGWTPDAWRLSMSMELGLSMSPEIAPIVATVPGSVHAALRAAGLLPDWNVGLNSRACEWVENRHWMFETEFPAPPSAQPAALAFEGLDGECEVWLNRQKIGRASNAFVSHRWDISHALIEGANQLRIVFLTPPRWLGQTGFTSQITDWKPRFSYTWDWIPRLVQIGIHGKIFLHAGPPPLQDNLSVHSSFDFRTGHGALHFQWQDLPREPMNLRLSDGENLLAESTIPADQKSHDWAALSVSPWEPNGNGEPQLYHLEVSQGDRRATFSIGFKQIEWLPCHGAPAQADPWLCRINGRDTFLQGVNWTPIRPNFADLTRADYELRLGEYQKMGMNCVRIWGGGFLEHPWLYDICDELGLLVWQDFPLSSSGLDNWPPENSVVIDELAGIARHYVHRLQAHPCLFVWCGGNELQGALDGGKVGIGRPVDLQHPLIARLAAVVAERDHHRRFLATTSSGPRFMAAFEDFGQGLHWDVHGPWSVDQVGTEPWEDYWHKDDSLFRSEMGNPGAQPADLFKKYLGDCDPSRPGLDNPYWQRFGWWYELDKFLAERNHAAWTVEDYVAWSQQRQTDKLPKAIAILKSRFPACGGVLIWMGHDSFPCAVNTSLLDFEGRPKPVVQRLAEVFRQKPGAISAPRRSAL